MKRIVLIGDSIRMGYDKYIKDALSDTAEGTDLIGGKVLSLICELLSINPNEVNIENFEPERYSKSNIGH